MAEFDEKRYFNIEAEVNTGQLDFALKRLPEQLKEQLLDALDHIRKGFFKALYYSTALKNKRFVATKAAGIGKYIRVYRNPRKGNILDMELGIFTRDEIVSIQEKGGTIAAREAKMLAIPIANALDESGRLKKWFRGSKKSYKDDELFVISSKGRLLLVKKSGGGLLAYFLLKKSVTLRPRLRFFDTWARMEGYRAQVIDKAIEKAINKA